MEELVVADDAFAALQAKFTELLTKPIDHEGHLALLLAHQPDDLAQAAVAVGQRSGNRLGPLKVLLHGLAALLEAQPDNYMSLFQDRLAAVDRHYLPPDLLNSLDRIVAELDAERERILHEASLYEKTGGLPLPRKQQMDASTGQLSTYDYGRLKARRSTLVASEEQLTELRGRYPVLLAEMGVYYNGRQNLVLAFDCFSRSISLDYEVFKAEEDRYMPAYISAAAFMILSAHRSDDVLAIYHLAPLDPEPLQRKVLQQIEARTQIYARAADQFTNHAQINQSLRDLLYTLIEDEGAIEFLPEQDRRKFLEDIGDTALAKRHFQEAIGVYTTLGENKKLIKLGRKLSKSIYASRRGQAYINRDLSWAIDAFREADAEDEMADLFERVKEAESELAAGRLVADDPDLLAAYVRELDAYLNGGDGLEGMVLGGGEVDGGVIEWEATPPPISATAEELPRLIDDYARQLLGAVPGEDVTYARNRLLLLSQQAEEAGKLDLAVIGYSALGDVGDEKVKAIVSELVRLRRYAQAADLLIAFGPRGEPQLKAIADEIVAQGVAPRGVYNPYMITAVRVLIHLDDVEMVEGVLNDLLKLKVQFAQLQNQAELQGRAIANRNLTQLEQTLNLINEAYDVVGSASSAPPVEPSPNPAAEGPTEAVDAGTPSP